MKQRFVFFACLAFNMLLFAAAKAQVQSSDSLSSRKSVEKTVANYYKSLKESAPFYNGSEFVGYGQNLTGHAFYNIDSLQKGNLYYDGTLYEGVGMMYDLVADEVIIRDYTNSYYIRLSSSKIKYFTLQGHLFINAGKDSSGSISNETGFYDRIYSGPSAAFVKRRKQMETSITSDRTINRFEQYDSYYVKKSDEFVRIGGKQTLLSLFGDKKSEIKKFISAQNLSFKKNPEQFIADIAAYYDSIKKH